MLIGLGIFHLKSASRSLHRFRISMCFPHLLCHRRIHSCIRRFRSRRRLQGRLPHYFNEYLFLGGIDASKSYTKFENDDYGGLTSQDCNESAATGLEHKNFSTAYGRFYNTDDKNWTVDFAGIAAGFFSVSLERLTSLEQDHVEDVIGLIENFLRYTLHHNVCPEYNEDINQALRHCHSARSEWPALLQLREYLPGPFNTRAAGLFSPVIMGAGVSESNAQLDESSAKSRFRSACALLGEVNALDAVCHEKTPELVREGVCNLEVTKIEPPDPEIEQQLERLTVDGVHLEESTLGKAFFKPAAIDDGWENAAPPAWLEKVGNIQLYFEGYILANMKPGTKMTITVAELDVGIWFARTISNIVPTFHTFLPQELMRYYKAPRVKERTGTMET